MKIKPTYLIFFFLFLFIPINGKTQNAEELYGKGKEAYYDGDYKKAEKLFLKTLNAWEKEFGPEHEKTLKAINRLAKTYSKLRQNEKALSYFEKVLEIEKEIAGPESEEVAYAYHDIGNVLNQMYEPNKAKESYTKALTIYEKIHGKESSEVGNILMVIGSSYHKMADYQDAEKYYLQAFEVFKKSSDPESEDFNRIYSNMGYMYRKIGDYEKALDFGKKALEIKLLNYDDMHPSVAKYHRNIGKVYEEMGQYQKALPYMQKAVEITEKTLGVGHPHTAGSYGELAHIYADLEKYETALKLYKKGNRLLQKQLPPDHPYVLAGYFNIAMVNSEQRQWGEALQYYRRALKLLVSRNYRPGNLVAQCLGDMAYVFYKKNELDTALFYCQNGLKEIAKNFVFEKNDFYKNPSPESVQAKVVFLGILEDKAKYLERRSKQKNNSEKDLDESLNTVQLAAQVIEKMRRSYQSETSRQYLNEESLGVFKMGVRVAMALYKKTDNPKYLWQAFELSEKNKASILWRSVNESTAMQNSPLPKSQKEILERLGQELSNLEEDLVDAEEEGDSDLIKSLQNEIFDVNLAYEGQIKKLEKEYPAFYQLRYAPPIVSENILAEKINDSQTVLLEYFYDDETMHVFLFDGKGLKGFSVPLIEDFQKTIQEVRGFNISNISLNNTEGRDGKYLKQLHLLYDQLIAPIKNNIADKSKLIIVPHGILNYLPYEMLAAPANETDFRNQLYLITQYSIQYAWSAALWAKEMKAQEKPRFAFAAFAPSYNNFIADVSNNNFRSSLSELTFTSQEVEQANSFFNGQIFLKNKATENAFRSTATKSRILHLATHAFADDEHPLQSKLVFANDADSSFDGLLHAYEIYNMRLSAEMAVMSACNTGYGQLAEGEGVISLGRAFFYAGCKSVIMSQWLANDQSTTKLMSHFYEHLANGKPKDEALRQAKLDYLAASDPLTSHPYFWAGMVAVGDMRAIDMGSVWGGWWWILIAVFVAGLVWKFKK